MVSDRRRGGESSAMRAELIDAAEQLIREEGYPAVTSRTLADKVGLKRQIVHYYFKSMDEVFIAVVRRAAEQMRQEVAKAAASEEPLRALVRLNRDPHGAILSMELHALANRRPAVREEVAKAAEEFRDLQTKILSDILARQGVDPGRRAVGVALDPQSLGRVVVVDDQKQVRRPACLTPAGEPRGEQEQPRDLRRDAHRAPPRTPNVHASPSAPGRAVASRPESGPDGGLPTRERVVTTPALATRRPPGNHILSCGHTFRYRPAARDAPENPFNRANRRDRRKPTSDRRR